jgi:hypothetical protein
VAVNTRLSSLRGVWMMVIQRRLVCWPRMSSPLIIRCVNRSEFRLVLSVGLDRQISLPAQQKALRMDRGLSFHLISPGPGTSG